MDSVVHQQSGQTHTCTEEPYTHLIAPRYLPTNSVLTVEPRFSISIQSIKIYTLETTIVRATQAAHYCFSRATRGHPNRVREDTEFKLSNLSFSILDLKMEYQGHVNESLFLYAFCYHLGQFCVQKNTYISTLCLLSQLKKTPH